ncbi:MerR family transcriptional regulator [bacterium]|nr:MerR family transcriptional regulator [bacterium]
MKKVYFSIGEVAELTGLQPHVLRYWETEFKQLRPKKGPSGARNYRPEDIELIQLIQHLLHEERYTIEGARRQLDLRREALQEAEEDPRFEERPLYVPDDWIAHHVINDGAYTVASPDAGVASRTDASRHVQIEILLRETRETLREIQQYLG